MYLVTMRTRFCETKYRSSSTQKLDLTNRAVEGIEFSLIWLKGMKLGMTRNAEIVSEDHFLAHDVPSSVKQTQAEPRKSSNDLIYCLKMNIISQDG
jgi:hypothetical protein